MLAECNGHVPTMRCILSRRLHGHTETVRVVYNQMKLLLTIADLQFYIIAYVSETKRRIGPMLDHSARTE